MKDKLERIMSEDRLRLLIKLGLAVVMVVCVVIIGIYYSRLHKAAEVYTQLQEDSVIISAEILSTEDGDVRTDMPEVDFDSLWETNTDICAWIYIPGTKVNYPVLRNAQSTDLYDDFYLNHTVAGAEGLPGTIYMEPCNMPDFSDRNTVLYGHHMKNGSMFASLDSYQDASFMEENPYVYIVTLQKKMVYRVYGAFVYDDTHLMRYYNYTSDESYQAYLDSLVDNGNAKDVLREDMKLTTQDKVLTLSTCIKNQDEQRLLLVAVLEDEYEY